MFAAAVATLLTVLLVVLALFLTRGEAVKTGNEALVGRTGIASSEVAPEGTVTVDRETWTAVTEGGPIHSGEHVEVTGVQGVVLEVSKQHPGHRHSHG